MDFTPEGGAAVAQYWAIGLGWGEQADAPPADIAAQDALTAKAATVVIYVVFPVLDLLAGIELSPESVIAKSEEIVAAIRDTVEFAQLLRSSNWREFAATVVNLLGPVLKALLESEVLVRQRLISAATASALKEVLSKVFRIGGVLFGAANLFAFGLTVAQAPAFAKVEVWRLPEYGSVVDLPTGVEIYAVATGDVTGHVADLAIRNLTDAPKVVGILPGISFKNETSEYRQDLTVTKSIWVTLAPQDTVTASVTGACIHLHKAAPLRGDVLRPYLDQRVDLLRVCQTAEAMDVSEWVVQEAVWVITDGEEPSCLHEVRQLFVAAGLDPGAYPALRGY